MLMVWRLSPAMPSKSFARRPDPSRNPGTSSLSHSPHKYSGPWPRPRMPAGRAGGRSSWAPFPDVRTVLLKGRDNRKSQRCQIV